MPAAIDYSIANDYLLSYPLIFACSIVNTNGDCAYKPEFQIPQMLSQWIVRRGQDKKIRGIKYFSCYDNDEPYAFNGFNVVIPAVNFNKRGYCQDLMDRFKCSKPRLLKYTLNSNDSRYIHNYKNKVLMLYKSAPFYVCDCIMDVLKIIDLLDKTIIC